MVEVVVEVVVEVKEGIKALAERKEYTSVDNSAVVTTSRLCGVVAAC